MVEQPPKQTVLRTFTNAVVSTTTVMGGLYVVRGYMRNQLEEVRMKMEKEQRAKEVLRTRFLQTQEDTSYTILALLPTLAEQILETMDVDAITRELQSRSRSARASAPRQVETIMPQAPILPQNPEVTSLPPSSISSSVDIVSSGSVYPPQPYPPISQPSNSLDETRSQAGSELGSSTHSSEADTTSLISESEVISATTQSWVVESGSSLGPARSRSPAMSSSAVSSADTDGHDQRLSTSIISVNTTTTDMSSSEFNAPLPNASGDTRSKAELWNEVKMLTFTRTLTTLYTSTLLTLFTTLQLTLLARSKYINAVKSEEKEERRREKIEENMARVLGMGGVLTEIVGGAVKNGLKGWFGIGKGKGKGKGREVDEDEDIMEKFLKGLGGAMDEVDVEEPEEDEEDEDAGEESFARYGFSAPWGSDPKLEYLKSSVKGREKKNRWWLDDISEEAEGKYLTMSWWLLHVGWKDVGERVRRAVEEVFDGVSLKTKLSAVDLHRLISDVRRRIEHEITFERNEKRTTFISSLLPPTPETIHHVLTQGGFTAPSLPAEGYPLDIANPRDLTANPDVDLDLELDLLHNRSTQSTHSSGSRKPWQPRDRLDENELQTVTNQQQHTRMPSDGSMAAESSSLKSSSLSHSFVDSPALAISARVNSIAQPQLPEVAAEPLSSNDDMLTPPPPRTNQTYFVPPPPAQPADSLLLDAPFLALMEETKEVLAGPDFARVLEVCLDTGMEVLFDGLERNIFKKADETSEEPERVRLAGLLPGLARWSQLALHGFPNELVDKTLNAREVSCLSAIVFARFEDKYSP
ncbi:hypothetical protein CPC08DRAFT_691571 [Agrocybe pediades]|nr:hypothetical protein CPC08DRAFT_691571 [Agrocybe pediades]